MSALSVICSVGAAVVALGISFAGRVAASEFTAWTPKATDRLIESALRLLPEDKRERYREEWAAHLDEVPGEVWKWKTAMGYRRAARGLAPQSTRLAKFSMRNVVVNRSISPSPVGFTALKAIQISVSLYSLSIEVISGTFSLRPARRLSLAYAELAICGLIGIAVAEFFYHGFLFKWLDRVVQAWLTTTLHL